MEPVKILETPLYTFDQLDDTAKERARDWYREGALNYEWWDFVYDDAKAIGKLLGITVDEIYFSGFYHQGQGACFSGSYEYRKGATKAVADYTGNRDQDLIQLARDLQAIQKPAFYGLSAHVEGSERYWNEHVGAYNDKLERSATPEEEEALEECMRDFAHWIFCRLESEFEWMLSDEMTDENILANEYTFTEEGERAG